MIGPIKKIHKKFIIAFLNRNFILDDPIIQNPQYQKLHLKLSYVNFQYLLFLYTIYVTITMYTSEFNVHSYYSLTINRVCIKFNLNLTNYLLIFNYTMGDIIIFLNYLQIIVFLQIKKYTNYYYIES